MARRKQKFRYFIVAATNDPITGRRNGRWETVVDEQGNQLIAENKQIAQAYVDELTASGHTAYYEIL